MGKKRRPRQASAKAVAATGPGPATSVDRQALIDISDALPIAVYHMENSPDGYRRFNFVSHRVESILGVSADEILRDQSSRWRHVYPEDLQRLQAHLEKTAAQAQSKGLNAPPFEFEFRLALHGEERWTRVAALPIRFLPGELSVWCGYYEDITQRRRDHAALLEAKEAAEDANRAKTEFLANMSHEIRTPLNTVIGLTHMLGETKLSAQQADYLYSIQRASRHLLRILNDILDLSKAESGRLHVEQVPFTLASVLQNLEQLTRSKAEAKGLALVHEVAPDVPADLIGDPLRLGQILLNYTDNAIKFTEQGTVSVCVTREPPVATNNPSQVRLRFAVRDTGIGLSDAEAHKLFQNFSQADASTTRKFGGTGLGLAICKRLAALMDGQVGLDSTQGQGSTFWFTAALGLHAGTGCHAEPPLPSERQAPISRAPASPEPLAESSVHFSQEALTTVVAGLRELLRQGDSEALDYLERHAAELQAALAAQFSAIQGHVYAFDFDEARALMDQW